MNKFEFERELGENECDLASVIASAVTVHIHSRCPSVHHQAIKNVTINKSVSPEATLKY